MKESHYTLSDLRDDCEGGGEALVKNEGRRKRKAERKGWRLAWLESCHTSDGTAAQRM